MDRFIICVLGVGCLLNGIALIKISNRLIAAELLLKKVAIGLVTKGIVRREKMLEILDEPLKENI